MTNFGTCVFQNVREMNLSDRSYDLLRKSMEGAIFDSSNSKDLKHALEKQIEFLSKQEVNTKLRAEIQELESTDSFAVSNAICSLLKKGVYGIIGISDASALSTIQSYSNTFKVPFISLSMTQNSSNHGQFQLFIRPVFINGLLDVIIHYGWERILYVYDTDEGLIRLQQLFQAVNARERTIDIDVKRVNNTETCYQELKLFHQRNEKANLRIFLDIPTDKAQTVIVRLKNDTTVANHKFHFLLGDLLEPALVLDSVSLLKRALEKLNAKNGNKKLNNIHNMKCTDSQFVSMNNGSFMMETLKGLVIDGLTGRVNFDENGFRDDFQIQLVEITMNMGLASVGSWKRKDGLHTHEPERRRDEPEQKNKTRIVTSILDAPYMMYKDEETKKRQPRCGKENFIGFCPDLAKKIASIVNINYDICVVKDLKYGERLDNDTWNGIIGELTRDETDLAIAPITITSERERVVDFTKPFMSLGISIMIRKTAVKKASVFSFMDPLSYEIWMCILFAYIGVSVVLFLVSRFSPTEWHVEEGTSISNDFTISNSLWYSLGAFMQQGCDISPRSVSGRIVGSVWWFFTLIIISSYTANLAAFLTVERMLTPIESAEDLAKQTEIQYGILDSGSTKAFFQQSKFPVHERMWAYMQSASPSVFVGDNKEGIKKVRNENYAFLIESTTNEYINMRKPCNTMKVGPNLDSKGYGIATPIGSDLRDGLTLAVLKLREGGDLEEMRKNWWERKSECPVKENNNDGGQAELTLENVAGIFYILVAGLALSVIMAFLEFMYKSKVDSQRSKKSFGSVIRCKARLSFRGSLDRDTPAPTTPLRKSMSTYTYTGPSHVAGTDGFPDNLHTQV
ncbi:Glutamate receptor 2 [Mactra antiquata]